MSRSTALAKAAAVVLPFAGYAWVLSQPQAGPLGMKLRYNLDASLLVAAGILFLALLPKGRLGAFTGLAASLALFALPLVGLWASAAGEMHVLGGLLYFSDTAGFYWDANRLLEGGLFSAFAARRPIFAGLLAGLLGITNHHLQLTLAILVALCAVCCFLAARELRQTHGAAAGALLLLLLFLFYRRFIGMTDTENLGLALGAAAFALLWRGANLARRLDLLAGTLLLTLAQITRAGAFLVLPALALWGGWRCHNLLAGEMRGEAKARLIAVVMLAEVITLGFVLNLAVFKATSNGQGSPFANSAYTFYGMAAGGKGWEQINQDAPAVTRLPEAQAAREINRMAWALIRANPARFGRAVLDQFADFFSLRDEGVFGFASSADVVVFDAPRPENATRHQAVRLLLYGLSLVGLYQAIRRSDAAHSLLLFLAVGLVLSVAFLPPRDAGLMRVYAASMPLLAAIPAVGLAGMVHTVYSAGKRMVNTKKGKAPGESGVTGRQKVFPRAFPLRAPSQEEVSNWTETEPGNGWILPAFGLTLAALVIAAPLAVRLFAQPGAPPEQAGCLPGELAVTVRISPGAYLRLVDDSAVPRTWLPEIRRSDFIASLRSFPHGKALAGLEEIPTPALLQNAIDLESGRSFWLVVQDGAAPLRSEVVPLCGSWNTDFPELNNDIFFGVSPQG